MEFYQISELAEIIGDIHMNTVDNWFKKLEAEQLHYVSRNESGQKVYDKSDLQIAMFIKERRTQEKPHSLNSIFVELKERFDFRPFPNEEETSTDLNLVTFERQLLEKVRSMVQEENAAMANRYIEEINTLKSALMEKIEVEGNKGIQLLLETKDKENQALLERIEQQEKYIEDKLNKRDERLLESIRESQQQVVATTEKKQRKGIFRFFGKD